MRISTGFVLGLLFLAFGIPLLSVGSVCHDVTLCKGQMSPRSIHTAYMAETKPNKGQKNFVTVRLDEETDARLTTIQNRIAFETNERPSKSALVQKALDAMEGAPPPEIPPELSDLVNRLIRYFREHQGEADRESGKKFLELFLNTFVK